MLKLKDWLNKPLHNHTVENYAAGKKEEEIPAWAAIEYFQDILLSEKSKLKEYMYIIHPFV